jgi:hypothetical protein
VRVWVRTRAAPDSRRWPRSGCYHTRQPCNPKLVLQSPFSGGNHRPLGLVVGGGVRSGRALGTGPHAAERASAVREGRSVAGISPAQPRYGLEGARFRAGGQRKLWTACRARPAETVSSRTRQTGPCATTWRSASPTASVASASCRRGPWSATPAPT